MRALPTGNSEHGKKLVAEFQCNRCHDDTGHEPMARDMHCVHCHQDILAGKFKAPPDQLARWRKSVDYVQVVPSLLRVGERLRGDWLLEFLLAPEDLRPHLEPTMPRLALSREQAEDIVAYLTAEASAREEPGLAGLDLERGRELLSERGCGSCHLFSGVAQLATRPKLTEGDHQANRAVMLAPDLSLARERFRPGRLLQWLVDPGGQKAGTLMPATGLSESEAKQVAAYLLYAPLEPPKPQALPRRLPVLQRSVSYAEVDAKVFRITCRHCHSNEDIQLGEGGPGNTGGFGFRAKRLNLSSHASIQAGYVDENGERRSIFAPVSDGTPRIVAAVLARQSEQLGRPNPEVRGMPLGLPALDPEQVQVLETWIAQGRPK
jgi:mono/diheme cytochrome c family protein